MPAPGWMRSMRGMPLVSKFKSQLFSNQLRNIQAIHGPRFSCSARLQARIFGPARCSPEGGRYKKYSKAEGARNPQAQGRVNSRHPIIRHDSQASGERFGLPRGERLPNIEHTKKYKAQQQIFPVGENPHACPKWMSRPPYSVTKFENVPKI